jgi:hypothetical protein
MLLARVELDGRIVSIWEEFIINSIPLAMEIV